MSGGRLVDRHGQRVASSVAASARPERSGKVGGAGRSSARPERCVALSGAEIVEASSNRQGLSVASASPERPERSTARHGLSVRRQGLSASRPASSVAASARPERVGGAGRSSPARRLSGLSASAVGQGVRCRPCRRRVPERPERVALSGAEIVEASSSRHGTA